MLQLAAEAPEPAISTQQKDSKDQVDKSSKNENRIKLNKADIERGITKLKKALRSVT